MNPDINDLLAMTGIINIKMSALLDSDMSQETLMVSALHSISVLSSMIQFIVLDIYNEDVDIEEVNRKIEREVDKIITLCNLKEQDDLPEV